MTEHRIGTRDEWLAAREELLRREKELTRRNDELSRERRELPWLRVEKDYRFETEAGTRTLRELFDGRPQLMIYNFMFGPAYAAGCPVCSSLADTFDGAVAHLRARGVTFTAVSRAPLDRLLAYRERLGWSFPWASSSGSDFNFDFGASRTEDEVAPVVASGDLGPAPGLAADCGTDLTGFLSEGPVLSSFALDGDEIYLTYSTTARGLEFMMSYYGLLDRSPYGRDEGSPPDMWIRRHDEYEAPAAAR